MDITVYKILGQDRMAASPLLSFLLLCRAPAGTSLELAEGSNNYLDGADLYQDLKWLERKSTVGKFRG